ncbi:MAG: 3'-5' exonuclease, partial [Candidatus Hydrogenedentota bacterium]
MNDILSNKIWIAIDTETTGLNPWKHELLEIGALRFSLEKDLESFEILIQPKKKQDPRARKVHNITNEELEEKGVTLDNAIPKFLEFIDNDPLIFHNAPFDLSFLTLAIKETKHPLPTNLYYDHLWLSRQYFPKRQSHSLENIRTELNMSEEGAHRALYDAKATAEAFRVLLKQNIEKLTSEKKYNKFLRYHRKFNEFAIKLPQNLEKIQKYFDKIIKKKGFIKISYSDKTGYYKNQIVNPLELFI